MPFFLPKKSLLTFAMCCLSICFYGSLSYGDLSSSEFGQAKKKLFRALKRGSDASEYISMLGSDNSKRAVAILLKVAVANISTSSYNAILDALGSMDSKKAIKSMSRKITSGKWPQKVIIATVFANFSDEVSEKALIKSLRDKYQPVLKMSIRALGKRKVKNAITPLIKLVAKYEKRGRGLIWQSARQGLTSITGLDFLKAELWKKWWDINKDNFDPNEAKGTKKTATVLRKGPKFFSEAIMSKRIIFIIDTSGSMIAEDPPKESGPGGIRIKRAKKELVKVIKSLSKKVKFNIIAYSHKLRPWSKGRLIRASRANKFKAIKFLETLKADGLTRTDKALEEAFKSPEANAFYLLTDGTPTRLNKKMGRAELINPKSILEKVQKLNRFRKVKIYTMGFAEEARKPGGDIFIKFLKLLAKNNEGRFSAIN